MLMGPARRAARRLLASIAEVSVSDPFQDMKRLLDGENVQAAFDVGGCFGVVAKRFEAMFPNARVFSFEPNPESFRRLQANVAGSKRIEALNLGAFSKAGTMTLHLNTVPGSSSLLSRPRGIRTYFNPRAVHAGATEVELVRLDDWAAAAGITRAEVLKFDIQGAELHALRGCERLLASASVVYSEVHFFPNYEGACLLDELWSFLRGHGFSLFQLYSVWGGGDGQLVQGDALFVSEAVRRAKLSREGPVQALWRIPP